ncbi:MAG: hypothetical protein K0Q47_1093 [Sedimentibacter sp.]|nr:hypothetical protein [Sedimentibacter sp.]
MINCQQEMQKMFSQKHNKIITNILQVYYEILQ